MAMATAEFTPVEARMLDVLADGERHTPRELHACLCDDLGPLRNILAHVTNMRKKLRPNGQDISCERLNGTAYYRLVTSKQ